MKISVIHNLYKRNPHVNESVRYNIHALEEINADYQYILFNISLKYQCIYNKSIDYDNIVIYYTNSIIIIIYI